MVSTEYTSLLRGVVEFDLGSKFKYLGYRSKLEEMIAVFKDRSCKIPRRRVLEECIVDTLYNSDCYTKYRAEYCFDGCGNDTKKLLCDTEENLRNQDKVNEAAKIYRECALRLPSNSQIDSTFIDGLYGIYSEFKSSEDYMKRLVHRRLKLINPELIKDNDTTRVLILKQFLLKLGFLEGTPYHSKAFEKYITAQKGVIVGLNEYNFNAITDSVFAPLEQTQNELRFEQEKLLVYLKYYGGLIPCLFGGYVHLEKLFSKDYIFEFEDNHATFADVFKIDLFKLSVDDIKATCTASDVEELLDELDKCKKSKESKKNRSKLLPEIPFEYKLSVLSSAYSNLELNSAVINQIKGVIPEKFLSRSSTCKTLGDVVVCNELTKIKHSDVNEISADKLGELLSDLEKLVFKFDQKIELKNKDNASKLSTLAKNLVSQVLNVAKSKKYLLTRISADLSKKLTNTLLLSEEDEIMVSRALAILQQTLVDYKEVNSGKKYFEGIDFDNDIEEVYKHFIKEMYISRLYQKADDRYKTAQKELKNKAKVADRDNKKISAEVIEMLNLFNNLSLGVFDNQRTMKELLYIFAVAFEMTVYTGASYEVYDSETEIQKKLFYDIYADNFVNRYKSKSFVELDGHGINFKNYVELCFLYAIYTKGDKSSKDVLSHAYRLIEYCQKNGKTKEELKNLNPKAIDMYTKMYKDTLFENILKAARTAVFEEEGKREEAKERAERLFTDYVVNHCICLSNTSRIRNSSENRTAQSLYKELYNHVKKIEKNVFDNIISDHIIKILSSSEEFDKRWEALYMEERCSKCKMRESYKNYIQCPCYLGTDSEKDCRNAFFDYLHSQHENSNKEEEVKKDIAKNIRRKLVEDMVMPLWNIKDSYKDKEDKNFSELLEQLQKEFKDSIMLFIHDNNFDVSKVTRTRFIAMYYYYMILLSQYLPEYDENDEDHEYDENKYSLEDELFSNNEYYESFDMFYRHVKKDSIQLKVNNVTYKGLDNCLQACGYQEVSPKNIFDVFVMFLIFRDYFNKFYNTDANSIL